MENVIKIRCKGNRSVHIDKLVNFQGDLKELSNENAKQLQYLIKEYGFMFPVFVWNDNGTDYFIDGHQRIAVIREMINHGWTIGEIPVIDINAGNKEIAKRMILASNSRFGRITEEGLYHFINDNEFDWNEINKIFDFPEINNDHFEKNYLIDEPNEEPGNGEFHTSNKSEIICPNCGMVISG